MGNLKRIIENNLDDEKNRLLFWEQQEEHLKAELIASGERIEQIKENIAEFEEFLADGQK